jgi:hypothetical protein
MPQNPPPQNPCHKDSIIAEHRCCPLQPVSPATSAFITTSRVTFAELANQLGIAELTDVEQVTDLVANQLKIVGLTDAEQVSHLVVTCWN